MYDGNLLSTHQVGHQEHGKGYEEVKRSTGNYYGEVNTAERKAWQVFVGVLRATFEVATENAEHSTATGRLSDISSGGPIFEKAGNSANGLMSHQDILG